MEKQHRTEKRIIVVFRNDDPSALMDLAHEREIFGLFEQFGVPQTLGVVPAMTQGRMRDPQATGEVPLQPGCPAAQFLSEYVRRSHSEIALHGLTHRTNRLSLPSRREFSEFSGLGLEEQSRMIARGTQILEESLGVRPLTFIPPWNRLDHHTVLACTQAGYRIISGSLHVSVPRELGSFGTNTDLAGFTEALAHARKSPHLAFINILFHSRTVTSREEKQLLSRILKTVTEDPDCQVLTLAEAVSRFPDALRELNEAGRNVAQPSAVVGSARARAALYRRVVEALRLPSRVRQLEGQSRAHYQSAEYAACQSLTKPLEHANAALLWTFRLAIGLAGLLLGILAALLSRLYLSPEFHRWPWVLLLVPLSLGALGCLRATSPDSRREMALAGGLATGGFLLGLLRLV